MLNVFRCFVVPVCLVMWCVWPAAPSAHEIPADITVRLWVKPEGGRLRVLVRVPLEAMRDVIFPTRGPGFLELATAGPSIETAAHLWIVNGLQALEDDADLGRSRLVTTRVSLPSDRSFGSWDEALAHLTGARLPAETELVWNQALLDALIEFPIRSDASAFSIRPEFARLGLRTLTVVQFLPPGADVRAFEYTGDAGLVRLDPRWHQAALRFVVLGIEHILSGVDHLLFLVCLVVPFRKLRTLVLLVTAFTVAHSVTLISAALGHGPDGLWFPPLVETLIAMSIVYMAIENILGETNIRRRWVLTLAFGLIHGFGFSFALRETLQFAGAHLITSLVAFNLGVEAGQVLALLVLVPLMRLVLRPATERIGVIIISVLVAHQAWHWMIDRGQDLWVFDWSFPSVTATAIVRAALLVWVAAGVWWGVRRYLAGNRRAT